MKTFTKSANLISQKNAKRSAQKNDSSVFCEEFCAEILQNQTKDFSTLASFLHSGKTFALFCHKNPDADALGAMHALELALKQIGKKVFVFCDDVVPANLQFLGINLCQDASKIAQADACIMLDCNTTDRIGRFEKDFLQSKTKLNIDHHQPQNFKFNFRLASTKCPSTCDLLFEFLKFLDVKITSKIAMSLYCGIASDTGCFKHASTNAQSHMHAAELLSKNFDLAFANFQMFKFKNASHIDFLKMVAKNTKTFFDGKLMITTISLKNYKKFEQNCEISGLDFLAGIEGNEIRIKIVEKSKGVFVLGLRSNKIANVFNVAKGLGGGGHKMAAGATVVGKPKNVLSKTKFLCKEELERCGMILHKQN